MAESIAEAEKEVASRHGEEADLQGQIKALEAASEVKLVKPVGLDGDETKALVKQTDDMVKEALNSRSQITYNGNDVDIKMNEEDAERN